MKKRWKKLQERRIFYRCVDWNKKIIIYLCVLFVASFTDAWIETLQNCFAFWRLESHLLQMRGLKLFVWFVNFGISLSHLLQMRGLKPKRVGRLQHLHVASFTDAWIETCIKKEWRICFGRIFYRCVDWNLIVLPLYLIIAGRIFYRCVDWNC